MTDRGDRVPGLLRNVLNLDIRVTKSVVEYAYKAFPQLETSSCKSLLKLLEISCHGVPWLVITLISIYSLRSTHNISVNLLLALLYDIVIVAVIKSITRRHRPLQPPRDTSPMFFTHGPDKFSFPSGHATRAVLLSFFFHHVTSSFLLTTFFSAWALVICISRVIMRRHHVLDVCCGVVIGVVEWGIVGLLWAGDGTTGWIGKQIGGAEDEFDGS